MKENRSTFDYQTSLIRRPFNAFLKNEIRKAIKKRFRRRLQNGKSFLDSPLTIENDLSIVR